MKTYLAIDAGGTYFKSVLLDAEAEILKGSAFKIRSYSEGSAGKIIRAYQETISNAQTYVARSGMELDGIGIATPGPFDYEKGIPLMKHKFSAIYGYKLRDLIYEIPKVSSEIPIHFVHDANATLAGELWRGHAKGFVNTALITLGTGLGFTFSQNGIIQQNNQGGPAISIFNLPYKDGILEDYISKRGFLKIYHKKSGRTCLKDIKVSELGKWADEGDKASIETFREVGNILANAIEDILNERGIQCLLLGGQISRSFHHMEKSLMSGLENIGTLQKISPVKNINNAALFGVIYKITSN